MSENLGARCPHCNTPTPTVDVTGGAQLVLHYPKPDRPCPGSGRLVAKST